MSHWNCGFLEAWQRNWSRVVELFALKELRMCHRTPKLHVTMPHFDDDITCRSASNATVSDSGKMPFITVRPIFGALMTGLCLSGSFRVMLLSCLNPNLS